MDSDSPSSAPQKPLPSAKRRRFRYSLGALLALVAVVAVLLAWWRSVERERERRFIAATRRGDAPKWYFAALASHAKGEASLEAVHQWSLVILEADLVLATTHDQRSASMRAHRARIEAIQVSPSQASSEAPNGHLDRTDYYVKEANVWLAKGR